MNIKKNTCVECGGWNGHHFTNCPETPEQNEPDLAECACLGGLSSLPPHTRKLVDATIMALGHACDGKFSDYCEDSDFGNELCEWLYAQKKRLNRG